MVRFGEGCSFSVRLVLPGRFAALSLRRPATQAWRRGASLLVEHRVRSLRVGLVARHMRFAGGWTEREAQMRGPDGWLHKRTTTWVRPSRAGWRLSKHVLRRPPTSAKSSAKLSWHGASRAAREEACFPKGKLPKILRRSERAAKRPGKNSPALSAAASAPSEPHGSPCRAHDR